jgi:predicted regulator of Ras-like GTPase activity (Roadblock/LC7/MglB family)
MPGTAPHALTLLDRLGDVTFLLDRLKDAVPGVLVAELATTDGLALGKIGLDEASAERLAAVAAGMHSLGLGIGKAIGLDRQTTLRQAFFETDTNRIFSMSAAPGTLLTVITSLDADPGLTGHEMTVLVNSVRAHLATPARDDAHQAAGGER